MNRIFGTIGDGEVYMDQKALTLQALKYIAAETIFASGVIYDPRIYRGGPIRWVAVRGGFWDWCIYYHHSVYDNDYVSEHGDKMITESVIKELVPCDDEAFSMYRY